VSPPERARLWPDYRTVWRWHFYAGLVCIPFVLWLSVTGAIYLFRPQIESWLDRPFENLQFSGPAHAPVHAVHAALAAVPQGVLNAYELPRDEHSAVRVLVGRGDEILRVYVHPQTLEILKIIPDDHRPMEVISHLHGELLQGDRGSMVVEAAASWTIVMLITGLFLWWPRGVNRAAGVFIPRLRGDKRMFWRDLHAVTAFWVSFFALFLLISGLPWTSSWGGLFQSLRSIGAAAPVEQDWPTGSSSERAARRHENAPPPAAASADPHAKHHMTAGMDMASMDGASMERDPFEPLDRLIPAVRALHLAPPVLIAPPSRAANHWTARSEAQNRPLRTTVVLDPDTGRVLSRDDFSRQPLVDRIVGVTTAAHEGQLFAPLNQLLGLFTAVGLFTLSISAIILWWRRRPDGVLGAPAARRQRPAAIGVFVLVALIGIALPLFGATLLALLALEWLVLRRHPAVRRFLGLAASDGVAP